MRVPKLAKDADTRQRAKGHLLGGRIRISTVVLIIGFALVWWVYDTYQPSPQPAAPQVVPPGFVPDPNWTWVPRTRVEQAPDTVTVTLEPSTVTETVTPTSEEPPPPAPPGLPCPPFCPLPAPESSAPESPAPETSPAPTPSPSAAPSHPH